MSADGPEFDLLFFRNDGLDARRQSVEAAILRVDDIPEEDIAADKLDALAGEIIADCAVRVPNLHRSDISFERGERNVRRRNAWGEMFEGAVTVFYFEVPFAGDSEIFGMRPSTYDMNPPRGDVRGDVLVISVEGIDDPGRVNQEVESTLNSVDQYLKWHTEMWKGLDEEIGRVVRGRLAERLAQRKKSTAAETELQKFGFKPKA